MRIEAQTATAADPSAPAEGEVTTVDGVTQFQAGTPQDNAPAEQSAPEKILGKFASQDDLIRAYQALEARLGQAKPVEEPAADKAPATQEAAQETVAQAGLDFDAMVAEFAEHGSLKEETLSALEAKGINRQTVDQYILGQQAIAQQITASLEGEVGGRDNLSAMLSWAATNLSAEEVTAYNDVIDSAMRGGKPDAARLALRGLQAKFSGSQGREPNLVQGTPQQGAAGTQPFGSTAEVVAAMRDPRYAMDPAYRRTVEARLSSSSVFG